MPVPVHAPNIVLIHSDQHRWDCVGANRQRAIHTPHLDRLAGEGANFLHAFTPCPICSPARASLLTGAWPTTHGCLSIPNTEIYHPARPELPLLSELLHKQGYFQGWIGKFHAEVRGLPTDHGVNRFVPVADYDAWREEQGLPPLPDWTGSLFGRVDEACPPEASSLAWQAGKCLDFLERATRQPATPFFLRWDPPEPHLPCLPTPPFAALYDPQTLEPWQSFPDPLINKPDCQRRQRDIWGIHGWKWQDWAPVAARYHAVVTELDAQIGRLLAYLDARGLTENTLVIYSSDHGDFCGGHGLIDKHFSMYDDITRVPLILRWPGRVCPGHVERGFVSAQLDIARTILSAAGIPAPDSFVGTDLVALAAGRIAPRPHIMAQYFGTESGSYSSRMLRTDRFKYCYNPVARDELYDLVADPGEIVNLIDDSAYAGDLRELRQLLAEEMRRAGDPLLNLWTRTHLVGAPPVSEMAV